MRFILIALLVVLLVLLSLVPIFTFDCWTHLAAGRLICHNLSIPSHDPFSWSLNGAPWVDHEWLFQIPAWLLYDSLGVTALVLAKAALVLVTFLLLLVMAYRSDHPALAPTLVALAALASYSRFMFRPELVSLLFLVLFLFILEHVRRTGRPRPLWLLLPLQLLWANLHAFFVVGNVVLVLYLLGDLLARAPFLSRLLTAERLRPPVLRLLALVCGLSFLVTLLNPYFLDGVLYPWRALAGLSSLNVQSISELGSPLGFLFTYWCRAFLLLAALALLALLPQPRRILLSDLFLLFLSLAVSLYASRNVPFFAVIAVMVASRRYDDFLFQLRSRFSLDSRWWFRWGLRPLLGAALVLFFAFLTWSVGTERLFLDDVSTRRIGLGVATDKFSLDSLDFLQRHHLDGDIANNFAIGGFLAFGRFPDNRVSVDGRAELYLSSDPARPDLLAFNAALLAGAVPLQNPHTRRTLDVVYLGLSSPIKDSLRRFLDNPDFRLVFADGAAVIFARVSAFPDLPRADLSALADSTLRSLEGPPPVGLFARCNFPWEVFNVVSLLDVAGHPDLAESVLNACIARYPDAAAPRFRLAGFLVARQRPQDALRLSLDALALDPDFPGLPLRIARACLLLDRRPDALEWLARARSQARFRPDDLVDIADLYLATGLPRQAADCLASAWRQSPSVPVGLRYVQALLAAADRASALNVAYSLQASFPDDPRVRQLLQSLKTTPPP